MLSNKVEEEILEEAQVEEMLGAKRPRRRAVRAQSLQSFRLSFLPAHIRFFASLMLCVMGLCYVVLLSSIWMDTALKLSYIIEGYASMGTIELIEHTFKYLPWFVMTFGFAVPLFLFSDVPPVLKRIFAAFIPVLIISDMGSMWLIRYHAWFACQLYGSGFLLAASFLVMFIFIQRELWRPKRGS